MTTQNYDFQAGLLLTTSEQDVYQTPPGKIATITYANIANDDANVEDVEVWVVPKGDTTQQKYKRVPRERIDSKQTKSVFAIKGRPLLAEWRVVAKSANGNRASLSLGGILEIDDTS